MTFEDQIEQITGLTLGGSGQPTTTQANQFLVDGVVDVIHRILVVKPEDAMRFATTTNSTSAVAVQGPVLSVLREHDSTSILRPCTPMNPAERYEATDPESLSYRSKYNPGYFVLNNEIVLVPAASGSGNNDAVVTQITYDTGLAVTDTEAQIANFPREYGYLVGLYASIQSLKLYIANLSLTDVSIGASPPDATSLSVTINTGNTSSSGAAIGSAIGSTPAFVAPTTDITLEDLDSDVTIDSASGILTDLAISAQVPTYQGETIDVNSSGASGDAPDAGESSLPDNMPAFTVPTMGGDSNDSNIYETLTGVSGSNTGNDADFRLPKKWFAAWGDMIEDQGDLEEAGAHSQKVQAFLNAWMNAVQQALHDFNSEFQTWNAQLTRNISNAGLDSEAKISASKNTTDASIADASNITQKHIQKVALQTQQFATEAQVYAAEVNSEVQAYTANLNRELEYYKTREGNKIVKYNAEVQAAGQDLQAKIAIHQGEIQRELKNADVALQEAIANKDRDLQAKIQQYVNQVQEYAAEVQRYAAEVNQEVQTAAANLQKEVAEYQRADANVNRLQAQYEQAFVSMGAPARQEGGR